MFIKVTEKAKQEKQIPSQIIVRPQQTPKIMMGSAANFKSKLEPTDKFTRPLMVDACSQTTDDDSKLLNDLNNKDKQTERDKVYMERIQELEEQLKAHSELLSNIHAASDSTAQLLAYSSPTPPPPSPVQLAKPKQIQTVGSQSSTQVTDKTPLLSSSTRSSNNLPTSSVMNPWHSLASTNTETIKYTIIAEGSGDDNGEPIKIQLAEAGGALDSSAHSGRLEICLDPEENVEIKTEPDEVATHYNIASSTEQNFIKRRKVGTLQNNALVGDPANCSTNQGLSKNSGENVITNNIAPQYQSRKSRLLNTYKLESYNFSANIQTTPVQSIKPSPDKKVSLLSGSSVVGGKPMERRIDTDSTMISIGPNGTRISAKVYNAISWNSASIATRKLLMAVFDRKTLATHSMTGKASPAFKYQGKPLKDMLDPMAIRDIIFAVAHKCNVSEKEVRNAITTKCADENKMMKLKMNKKTRTREVNKENIAAGCSKKLQIGIVNYFPKPY